MLPMWAGNHVMCGDVRLSPPVSWKILLTTVAAFLETRAAEKVLMAVLESE